LSALSSTSIKREPLSYEAKSFVRGKSGQFPFAPGGLGDEAIGLPEQDAEEAFEDIVKGVEKSHSLGRGGIKTIPPGFERGLDFDSTAAENDLLDSEEHHRVEPIYRPLVSSLPETNGVRIFRPVSKYTSKPDWSFYPERARC
jgi:antiviral helicase SKI2